MLTTHFQQQFAYNEWAWQQVLASVRQLSPEQRHAEQGFFWGSMFGMLVHGLAAEFIWLERLNGRNPEALLTTDDFADSAANLVRWRAVERDDAPLAALMSRWETVSAEWRTFIPSQPNDAWQNLVNYRSTSSKPHQLPQAQIVQHVLLHGMEHRSQLTPVLFKLGAPTQGLDFVYYRLQQTD